MSATKEQTDAFRTISHQPIATLADARAYLQALIDADLSYHLEDSPETVENIHRAGCIFEEPAVIRARARELYALPRSIWGEHDCPIGFMMMLEGIKVDD